MTIIVDGTNGITTPKDVEIQGTTSGSVTLVVPAVAGSSVITLPAGTGTAAVQGVSTNIVSGTAVASTSGTSIDFTGIPAYAKRITVMFSGVSASGTSLLLIQIGTTSGIENTAYNSACNGLQTGAIQATSTTGFLVSAGNSGAATFNGSLTISNLSGNIWVESGVLWATTINYILPSAGIKTLAGVLDRVRLTTVNGTDTFDAGTINILYE